MKTIQRNGVPLEVRRVIEDLYKEAGTEIFMKTGTMRKIMINAGIRQGFPLSTLLFNLVMEELLERVEAKGYGAKINSGEISIMAGIRR